MMHLKNIFSPAALFSITLAATLSANPVTAWVPPYSIPACKTMLEKDFGGVGMKDGLTLLPLQFYKPSGAQLVKAGNIPDSDIQWFITWGHKYNIKVLLCIYNYINDWDWPAARTSFLTNRAAFVKAVVAEVQRTGLDGVDIDFEGPDVPAADRDAYIAFAKDLCDSLHPKNKIVTVASFPAQWNAPNWDWWTPLYNTAKVDGICTMGYDWSGKNKDYAAQVQHASAAPAKFMIGMPGWVDTWQSNTASEQLDWIIANGVVGIGIWDAALTGGGQWQDATVWNKIKQIRQMGATPVISSNIKHSQAPDNISITTVTSSNISISVRLQKPGRFAARIYDLGGRMIKELCNNDCMQNTVQLGWNGYDGNGAKVSAGSYVLAVSANGIVVSKAFVLAR